MGWPAACRPQIFTKCGLRFINSELPRASTAPTAERWRSAGTLARGRLPAAPSCARRRALGGVHACALLHAGESSARLNTNAQLCLSFVADCRMERHGDMKVKWRCGHGVGAAGAADGRADDGRRRHGLLLMLSGRVESTPQWRLIERSISSARIPPAPSTTGRSSTIKSHELGGWTSGADAGDRASVRPHPAPRSLCS